MKKILSLTAIALFSFSKSQITLEHTFSLNNTSSHYRVYEIYSNGNDTFYYLFDNTDQTIKMYNSDYSLRKIVNVNVPVGHKIYPASNDNGKFAVTKNIINNDNLYEFIVYSNNGSNSSKLFVINENSNVVYDFGTGYFKQFVEIFNDKIAQKNKLYIVVDNSQKVYSLPTTVLSVQELETLSVNEAFPNPAYSEINIPLNSNRNGVLKVYNANGQLIENRSIHSQGAYYKLLLNNYQTGMYFYEYNGNRGKFIVK